MPFLCEDRIKIASAFYVILEHSPYTAIKSSRYVTEKLSIAHKKQRNAKPFFPALPKLITINL